MFGLSVRVSNQIVSIPYFDAMESHVGQLEAPLICKMANIGGIMLYGCWGDHLGDAWAYVSYAISRGWKLTSVTASGSSIESKIREIIPLLDISVDPILLHSPPDQIINEYDAWASDYIPTSQQWVTTDRRDTVAYQFDGRLHADGKNPPEETVDSVRELIMSSGLTPVRLGGHYSLKDCVAILAESVLFVGADSGMSHIAHSVGVPCVLYQRELDVRPYHIGKEYTVVGGDDICNTLTDLINYERASSL